ncbi:MAG: N-6 DNA methylase [Anaerolineales bacterium]
MSTPDLAYTQIESLVHKFKAMPAAQRRGMNEMQTRLGFILPLFSALGWDTSNINEVSPEEKVSRGWVDFSFRLGGVPRFFLETKKASENLNDPRWVKQSIDYAWTKSVTWALLSDFEGLRVFNAEWRESDPFRAQFFEFDMGSYLTDFERLWWLSRPETAAGRLDREAEKVGRRIKRLPVSQSLFDDLKVWRADLYKNLKGYNLGYSPAQIDEAVLRILNRIIFIRTTEDRAVEPNRLQAMLRELEDRHQLDRLSGKLTELFREFDATYNSELFARHFSEELYCDRMPLEAMIGGLYEKDFVRYNFNAIDADVLGTAYEQYLGQMVAEAEGETHTEEKRAKRKSQGIYYTPTFVTKYIVKQTVGRWLDEHGYNPSRPPRVLDMACGSGSFLIEAFDALDRFVATLRGQVHGGEMDFSDRARQLEVLLGCIFGVDKDKQAVDVARLNLLLRALHSREKLPLLTNIYNGDSLHPETWAQGFADVMKEGGFDIVIGNPPYVRIQTLDKGEVEYFNQNFVSATGNYDIYVLFVEQALKLLKPGGVMGFILPNKFMQVDYGIGLRKLLSDNQFIDKVVDFKEFQVFEGATTYTCLLFLKKEQNPKISILSVTPNPHSIVDIFDSPIKELTPDVFTEKPWSLSNDASKSISDKLNCNAISLLDLPTEISRGSSSGADDVFILKKVGENTYKNKAGKVVEIESDILRIPLYATDFNRYLFHPKSDERIVFPYTISGNSYSLKSEEEIANSYPKAYSYLESQREKLEQRKDFKTWFSFSAPRNLSNHDTAQILVPLLANKGLYSIFESNKDFCLMASGGFSISVSTEGVSKYFVLGLLNSKALFWCLSQTSNVFRGGWITCTKQYVGPLPIHRIDFAKPAEKTAHDEMVELVGQMLALHKELSTAELGMDDARFTLKKRIAALDVEIDRRVYALYGLSEAEIAIVEGKK